MKKASIVVLTLLLVAALACRKSETTTEGTETIAPAAPQPADSTDTAEALTQTVDVETGRSEAEGGALTAPGATTTTTGTTGTTATTTAPAATAPPTTTTR